ncbi:MAG: Arthrobacter phage BarretLemon [Verrucomicrobiota bacterium]|jgi:hypothetical protein
MQAVAVICGNHYTRSVPSGKSHYMAYEEAIIVWSIPANYNIGRFLVGEDANVWELARLWAPDGHRKNLLTQAIAASVKELVRLEKPDALVSYADPTAGHRGGIYRAASWIYHGQSDESRNYEHPEAGRVARRAFHSGRDGMTKAEIEAQGWREVRQPGKLRFVKPLSKKAKRAISQPNRELSEPSSVDNT